MRKWIGIGVVIIFTFVGLAIAQEYTPSAPAAKATYVGVDKCKTCHPKSYETYLKRKFSKSMKVIKMRGKQNDPECLKCHTTGYGEPGGFVSTETTPHLENKQCESCHGPGSLHIANPSDAQIRAAMKAHVHAPDACTKCHVRMKAHRVIGF